MTQPTLGWGIVATGTIATKFAEDLGHVAGGRKAAVCSRSRERAEDFAALHGFAHAHDDFDAFLADPAVEAVYLASPNTAHLDQALAVIAAGKAVMIEKPLAMNAAEARRIAEAAAAKGVFAMEALWTRFLPAVQRAKALIASGTLGAIERAEAGLSFVRPYDAADRLFDPALGGGALHDLGVYPLSVATMLLGDAADIDGRWRPAPTGTDMSAEISITCGSVPVSIHTGFDREGENSFVVYGAAGTLRIDRHFLRAASLTLWDRPIRSVPRASGGLIAKVLNRLPLDGRRTERFAYPGHGLHFEARSAQATILAGETQSAVMPMEASARVLEIIETVLAKPPAA